MKRILLVTALLLVILALLTACGKDGVVELELPDGNNETQAPESTTSANSETPTTEPTQNLTPSEELLFVSNGDGTCYVAGIGTCTDKDLVIPHTSPAGDTVTSIGIAAFAECSGLTSITIPNGVTRIEADAFSGCSGLTSIFYQGIEANWGTITKGENWDANTGDYKIYFSSSLEINEDKDEGYGEIIRPESN